MSVSRSPRRVILAIIAFALGSLAGAPPATAFPANFIAPSFVRQWDPGPPAQNFRGAIAITADPFGDVYVLRVTDASGGGSFRIQKYQQDGTPITGAFDATQTGLPPGGLATDPQGHVFVAVAGDVNSSRLREYTSAGGLLGELKVPQLQGTAIAFDAAGHLYGNGYDAAHKPALNEYTVSAGTVQLIASMPYPGSPNTGFFPSNFIGLAIDDAGNVYASGESTTDRFLAKYAPGLTGQIGLLEDCPKETACFGGFGLAFTHTGFLGGPTPTLYSGGGYGGGAAQSNFYRMGIYSPVADVPSGSKSDYLGSFGPAPVPSGAFASAPLVAASPCRASVYILASVFGGPNSTFNGNEVQQFDTHVAPTPCAVPVASAISGFKHKYTMKKPASGTPKPCTPCAELLASGQFATTSRTVLSGIATGSKKRTRGGVLWRFNSSAAADVTFLFKKKPRKGRRARSLGGFVYPAQVGANGLRFSGNLHRGKPLRPGTYRVSVSGGGEGRRFKLIIARKRRGR
jgi:hypothetical protein